MLRWFTKNKNETAKPLLADLHSHLLPGLDDGVESFEAAKKLVQQLIKLGYQKIITTPHILSDTYKNTPEIINAKLLELQHYLTLHNITIPIEAAAEYYLDEYTFRLLAQDKPLLTFGDRYLLFETNFLTQPFNLNEFIFLAITKGYRPVMAHPERYLYYHNGQDKVQELLDRGVLFQLNISSLTGYYSKPAQLTAQKFIDKGWVHFLGSDCHHERHIKLLEEAQNLKYYKKALALPLLNNSL